jgi:hypothetical protein
MTRIQQFLSRFWLLVMAPLIFLCLYCAWFTPWRLVVAGFAVLGLVVLIKHFALYSKRE